MDSLIYQSIGSLLVKHRLIDFLGANHTACGLVIANNENVVTPETAEGGEVWHADHQAPETMVLVCELCTPDEVNR